MSIRLLSGLRILHRGADNLEWGRITAGLFDIHMTHGCTMLAGNSGGFSNSAAAFARARSCQPLVVNDVKVPHSTVSH